jgi:hypothetical protein
MKQFLQLLMKFLHPDRQGRFFLPCLIDCPRK